MYPQNEVVLKKSLDNIVAALLDVAALLLSRNIQIKQKPC
jgi:hypothetical protein